MVDTVYYTYSTIAQVLGALVALTGVFAVFRISALLKRVDGYVQVFFEHAQEKGRSIAPKVELWKSKLGRDYTKILLYMRDIMADVKENNPPFPTDMKETYEISNKLYNLTRTIKIITVIYVAFSVLLIFGSIYILLNPHLPLCQPCINNVTLLLLGFNLTYLVALIWISL